MPVLKSLCVTEYLASHPQDINVTFSFPDGRQLGANRMFLSASCKAFEAMFSGDWKEETVINLPDTKLEAFELFTKILYAESVNLVEEADILILDQLYYLSDKYMVEEIKVKITGAAEDIYFIGSIENLSLLEHIKTDAIKEIVTTEMLSFLSWAGAVMEMEEISTLAIFYCSGEFSEAFMDAMVKAAVSFIVDPDFIDGVKQPNNKLNDVFTHIPETEENIKFMFKVMKLKGQMNK